LRAFLTVIASLFLLSLRAQRGNPEESQNSKIKRQNDRAKFKNVVRGFSLVHDPEGSHYKISIKLMADSYQNSFEL
jgi:hypothetical protein